MLKRKILLGIALALCLTVGLVQPAHADVNNFTVTNFSADYTLTNADPQGQLHVKERISVDFTDYNHGILRAIPDMYKGSPLHLHIISVTSDSGAPASYTTYGQNSNTVLKIGDPARTVTGQQEYNIDYTVDNVVTFYKDHDELYWDINGDQWNQPFEQVNATFHLPAGLAQSRAPVCYSGSYGSTAEQCNISQSGETVSVQATHLAPLQTLSIVIGFSKGYFAAPTFKDRVADYWKPVAAVLVLPIIAGVAAFRLWWRRGRDAKGTGVIVPQYDAPDGLTPLEAGTLVDFNTDNRDLTATLIDLARRGYLKIIETDKKHLFGKSQDYSLQLEKADFSGLKSFEQDLLNAVFGNPLSNALSKSPLVSMLPNNPVEKAVESTPLTVGQTADISASKNKLFTAATTIRRNVKQSLTTDGYFRSKLFAKGVGRLIAAGAFGIMLVFVLIVIYPLLLLGVVLAVLVSLPFFYAMAARTAKGTAAKEYILGLKMYMEVAEKDRMEKLEGPNAAYAKNANEPVRTVELFEKLLPYAVALGVEAQWAGKFKDLYTQPPDWYSGNWSTFNAVLFANNLNSGFANAVNSSFAAPASSGSSGFGGGGSAGGGGGGGGGGGW